MRPRVDLERVYRATPVWAQDALASLHGWRLQRERFGNGYAEVERHVIERRSLSGSALVEFQARRLTAHLQAAQATAFWRVRFAEHGVNPAGSDPFIELHKLPVLTKAEVRAHASEIRSSAYEPGELITGHTSGTTGAGLVLWETRAAIRERWAVWWRYRRWFGLDPAMRSGHFGGRSVVPITQSRPPYWRRNHPGRQLLLSAYHLNAQTVEAYWRALREWDAEWLHGYPSFLALFADLCRLRNLPRIDSVRVVTVGAENLLANQRRSIESVFGVPVRQHYGLAEGVANVSEHPDGRLRVDEDYALTEFVPANDSASSAHRILGTNWSNPAFPLFRYDTGDVATLPNPVPVPTDVWREVTTIDGREEDYVLLPDGSRVGRLDHVFKDLVHIREAQIYQPAADLLVLRIVKGPAYDEHHEEERLLLEMRQRVGSALPIRIEYLDDIPRSRRGKLRFVVSELTEARLQPSSS